MENEVRTAIEEAFRNWSIVSGRAARFEYWWFHAFMHVMTAAGFLVSIVFAVMLPGLGNWLSLLGLFGWLLATFVISLSLSVRRLHDINRSGWWLLAYFVALAAVTVVAISADSPATVSAAGLLSFIIELW